MPEITELSNIESLVAQLNTLLGALHIPIRLTSPTELTPSLLLAIISHLIDDPIPPEFLPHGRASKDLQSMKFFLGALGSDIIQQDVGLNDIDPRRLAAGEWEEVTFVGELLCWVGRNRGFITSATGHSRNEPEEEPHSPAISATSNMTKETTTVSNLSLYRPSESNTSISLPMWPVDTMKRKSARQTKPSIPPHCIHEIPSPIVLSPKIRSSFTEESYCLCSESSPPKQQSTIRYSGHIELVDEELELQLFEDSKSMSKASNEHSTADDSPFDFLRLRDARSHTVFLLSERARLLEELSALDLPP